MQSGVVADNRKLSEQTHNPEQQSPPVQRRDCLKKSDFYHVCLPFIPFFDHGIEDDEQFPHGSYEGDHFGLSVFHEPFVERFDPGVVIQSRDSGM